MLKYKQKKHAKNCGILELSKQNLLEKKVSKMYPMVINDTDYN